MQLAGELHGIQIFGVEGVLDSDEVISSTRIRQHLVHGSIETVNRLLGYPYQACGPIVGRIGRKFGFPTLNLNWNPACEPRYGVYAVRFRAVAKSIWQLGVANYGIKPTLQSRKGSLLV